MIVSEKLAVICTNCSACILAILTLYHAAIELITPCRRSAGYVAAKLCLPPSVPHPGTNCILCKQCTVWQAMGVTNYCRNAVNKTTFFSPLFLFPHHSTRYAWAKVNSIVNVSVSRDSLWHVDRHDREMDWTSSLTLLVICTWDTYLGVVLATYTQ